MLRFPWQKEPAPKLPDMEEMRAQIADEVRQEIVAEVRQELASETETVIQRAVDAARRDGMAEATRALVNSPLPPVPDPNQRSPYQAYAMDKPITFATPQAPTRRPGTVVSTDTLRALADNCDILRSCINHLKREVLAVPLEVVPRDPKDQRPKTKRRLKEAQALFTKKGAVGGPGTPRRHFEGRLIEDLCVIGAGAVFHRRSIGGKALASIELDASTIRPFVDAYGWMPGYTGPGSDHAYEQWIYGVQAATFSRADLIYDGIYPSSYSPYFKSPVEFIIDAVDTSLRSNMWNKGWLTDGTSPDEIYSLPETWTPSNVRDFAEWWDSIQSAPGARHKTRFLPGNSGRIGSRSRKDQDFTGLDLWLLRRICSIMGVQPASIGFVGEQYKVSQDASMSQTSVFGAGIILAWRKEMYDEILEAHNFEDFEVVNVLQREESAKVRAETNEVLIRSGQRSINEVRQADGEDPTPDGDVFLVQKTLVTLESVKSGPVGPDADEIDDLGDPKPEDPNPGDPATSESDDSDDSKNDNEEADDAD